ncbi:amidase [Salinadaptatus halalkaliphilus]|uniref:Amidase n=1 Tax=Salinadaptatus halalkaliphilus TaxID=2419781 RepID=A0A4S3TQK3_9EURY|nr:amidase [Salinadaptatus halalkaliphilus]THE66662.1 amidase [Salinadaptatus halalkaliphilus]
MTQPLTRLTAAALARRIRDGEHSPTAVTETFLERIHERNDRTNAFVTVTEEYARERAEAAERALADGEVLGPLHGVPVAIKDLDDVAGCRTTSGSLLFEDRIADDHSPFVARLEAAGAIVVGKTNTPEFGLGTTTDNRVAGPTGTPFDPDRVSGGSSGGAAAALGDMLVPLAPGSDAGGSIRIPASLCGVYGLKPTYGLIPNVSRPNGFASHTPFSHKGPMARSVEDAALALDVMAGPHPRDPFSVPAQESYREAVSRPIDELKIAYSPDMGIYPVEPAVRDVLDDAIAAFERAGATVDTVDPELGHDQTEIMDAFYTMATVRWQSLFDELEDQGFDPRGSDRDRLRPYLVDLILEAETPTTPEAKRADVVRTNVFDGLQDLFAEYDLLATATLATTAFPHGEEPETIDGTEIEPLRGWVLTQPYNLTGHPAASIPAGLSDGLPVGLQLAGQRHADDAVIAASGAFERQRPWDDDYPT